MEHPDRWSNEYLVYLKANLEEWYGRLKETGTVFSEFREPDIGERLTAIAVQSDGKQFSSLRLLK